MTHKLPHNMIVRRWTTKKGVEKTAYYHRSSRDTGRVLTPLGTSYKDALAAWAVIEGLRVEAPKSGTVADIYAKYSAWANNTALSGLSTRTLKDRDGYWPKLRDVFGHVAIDTLRPEWMLQYFESRSSQISAKKELKFLSVICNWAKARGLMTAANPTDNIMRQLRVDEKRDIYVTDESLKLVYKHGSQLVRDTLTLTYLCANRPDETAQARLSDIDGDELIIRLAKTEKKGNSEKRIPITGELKAFIERQKRRAVSSLYLVSDERGQQLKPNGSKFRKAFKQARDAAEAEAAQNGSSIQRFQLKDLRAKAGTDIARNHGIEAARLALGHTTQKQTNDYIRQVKGALMKAAKGSFVSEMIGGGESVS